MRSYRILPALMLGALALSLTGCSNEAEASETPESDAGIAVQVTAVESGDMASENRVSGRVSSDNEQSIYISQAAKCTAVYVRAGDTVAAGDKLCTLDMAATIASYDAASTAYNAAAQSYSDQSAVFDAQIAMYEKNLSDLQALYEIGAASQMEIDNAELSLMSAQATRNSTLAQLEATMKNSESQLEQLSGVLENVDHDGNVTAPIAGTVASLSAEKDAYVSASMPVAVIVGEGGMEVTAAVSESLVTKINSGDTAEVSVSAAGQSFEATVRSVDRTANAQTRLYNVTLTVPDGVAGLLSGMSADVNFLTDVKHNALMVPTEAILTGGDAQYVFVAEDGTARYVEVATGLTGSGVTEIVSGLSEGDLVVTVGQTYLADGDAVRIVEPEA